MRRNCHRRKNRRGSSHRRERPEEAGLGAGGDPLAYPRDRGADLYVLRRLPAESLHRGAVLPRRDDPRQCLTGYRQAVDETRASFDVLDSFADEINEQMKEEDGLDRNRIKAVFFLPVFRRTAAGRGRTPIFVDCFVTWTEEGPGRSQP